MKDTVIQPHRITKPIQIIALFFAALVILVAALLTAARLIEEPPWLGPLLAIAAVFAIFVFAGIAFVLITRHRTQFLDDTHYSDWLKWNQERFEHFKPENQSPSASEPPSDQDLEETWIQREKRRVSTYKNHKGLFLVHSSRPSVVPGQVADLSIWLHQHGTGPLTYGEVESVEYHLGPKFFRHPVIKTNSEERFRLGVSAYGPMLCLARVNFKDGSPPLDLERYVNL